VAGESSQLVCTWIVALGVGVGVGVGVTGKAGGGGTLATKDEPPPPHAETVRHGGRSITLMSRMRRSRARRWYGIGILLR
jgi:hypothetical protein